MFTAAGDVEPGSFHWLKQPRGSPVEDHAAVPNNPVSLLCCLEFLEEVCPLLPWTVKGWLELHPGLGISPTSTSLHGPQHQSVSPGVMVVLWKHPSETERVSSVLQDSTLRCLRATLLDALDHYSLIT